MTTNGNSTQPLPEGNWITGDTANTIKSLIGQLDLGSYDDLTADTCDVFDEKTGEYCSSPDVVARFWCNDGLRFISVCPEHRAPLLVALQEQTILHNLIPWNGESSSSNRWSDDNGLLPPI